MSFPLFSLEGRRALITGSSQGIGLALAKGLAEHGAAVVLNGRDRSRIEAAAATLSGAGHAVSTAVFDVTSADEQFAEDPLHRERLGKAIHRDRIDLAASQKLSVNRVL